MKNRRYEELDHRREHLVKVIEGIGVFGFIVIMIFAWVAVPA